MIGISRTLFVPEPNLQYCTVPSARIQVPLEKSMSYLQKAGTVIIWCRDRSPNVPGFTCISFNVCVLHDDDPMMIFDDLFAKYNHISRQHLILR